jgi:hypothetical protein
MYMPLMRVLGDSGIRSVACNQRGYSPLARPPLETDYDYNNMKSDVFALAEAASFPNKVGLPMPCPPLASLSLSLSLPSTALQNAPLLMPPLVPLTPTPPPPHPDCSP